MAGAQNEALRIALDANAPIIMWGEPGIGKTATVQQMVRERKGYMYTFIASQRDPVDLTGAMHPAMRDETPVTRYSPPEWAVILNEHALKGDFTVLFLDEFSTAPAIMQAACLRLLHEKMVGDYELDDNVRIVLAANPADVAAYGHDLAPPTANRICHIEWTLSADEWAEGILYQGWIPELKNKRADEILRTEILPTLSAYVQRTGLLLVRPKSESEAGRAWPSGRTWAMGATLLAESKASGGSEDAQAMLLMGAVGASHAQEYLGYVRELDLPDPEYLLKNPDKFKIPGRQDQVFAVLGSVVSSVATDKGMSEARNVAAWKILAKVAEGDGTQKNKPRPDLAAAHARTLAQYMFSRKDKDKLGNIVASLKPFHTILKNAELVP